MILPGREIRSLGRNATTMEAAAKEVTTFLYNCFRIRGTQDHCCALVRCFKTHPYDQLPPTLQAIARQQLQPLTLYPGLRCLTLLASRGDQPGWNDPQSSRAHQTIPLPSTEIVGQAPMISQLIRQMGLDLSDVVGPANQLIVDAVQRSFNVFHVEDAQGSPYVPAQPDFVIPTGIRSVLGFGGLLTSGELFAIVMFSKVHISRETAELFKTLALNVKLVLLPFSGRRVFENK